MSAPINDGGPARPCIRPTGGNHLSDEPEPVERWPGMSLRDYFAAAALPALIALEGTEVSIPAVCEDAYDFANAMLKARER